MNNDKETMNLIITAKAEGGTYGAERLSPWSSYNNKSKKNAWSAFLRRHHLGKKLRDCDADTRRAAKAAFNEAYDEFAPVRLEHCRHYVRRNLLLTDFEIKHLWVTDHKDPDDQLKRALVEAACCRAAFRIGGLAALVEKRLIKGQSGIDRFSLGMMRGAFSAYQAGARMAEDDPVRFLEDLIRIVEFVMKSNEEPVAHNLPNDWDNYSPELIDELEAFIHDINKKFA